MESTISEVEAGAAAVGAVRPVGRVRSRERLLVYCLAAIVAGFAWHTMDTRRLEKSLLAAAEGRAREAMRYMGVRKNAGVVAEPTVSRSLVLLGPAAGKVAVYTRFLNSKGTNVYSGVHYMFEQVDGKWIETESGSCTAEECLVQAKLAFGDRSGLE